MGIEKAFDLLDHTCLIFNLEKYGFGKNLILWLKILLRDKGSRALLKVHQCRCENRPVCSCSYKNNILNISHS